MHALGLKFISGKYKGAAFAIPDGGELIIADSPRENADAIVRLLEDADSGGQFARQLGAAGRRFVEANYGWPEIVPRLEAVYGRSV